MSALEHNPFMEVCDCEDCRFWEAIQPLVDKYRDSATRQESLRLFKAVRLAPSLEVCEALLRGEAVPVSALSPEWREAYGL